MKVVFRADLSLKIASGHIRRCLTLAEHLSKNINDLDIVFYCTETETEGSDSYGFLETHYKIKFIKRYDDSWLGKSWQEDLRQTREYLLGEGPVDLLIIDQYEIDHRWESKVRDLVPKIMVFDDMQKKHDCDILLSFFGTADLYSSLIPPNCLLLVGYEYALLNKAFIDRRSTIDGPNVLIFFGGCDGKKMTMQTIESLYNSPVFSKIKIDLVLGSMSPDNNKIRNRYGDLISIHESLSPDEMADLTARAKICIGCGGGAALERCALGKFTLVINMANNQERNTRHMEDAGVIEYLGFYDDPNVYQKVAKRLEYYMELEESWFRDIDRRCRNFVDGQGYKRIVEAIHRLLMERQDDDWFTKESYVYKLDVDQVAKDINDKVILITGGTGSFGKRMIKTLLKYFTPRKIIILSRDEYKQYLVKKLFKNNPILRFLLGDIRDYDRLQDAFRGVDIVFHGAALKQIPATEYNPFETVKTNINGSKNVIRASIFNKVSKVIAISTDKCVNPVNLYGATKLCSERLFTNGNLLDGGKTTRLSVLRYGNVLGSRGSVLPIFLEQAKSKVLTITDPNMTRFTITLQDAVHFVLKSMAIMIGGEVFVPKLPSYNILQLANVIAPESEKKIIGIRPGEKLHESMISSDESYNSLECDNFFVVKPFSSETFALDYEGHYKKYGMTQVESNYTYSSENNIFITDDDLGDMIKIFQINSDL